MSFTGRFVWYELMTTDAAAAKAFYGQVVGWSAQDMAMSEGTYSILSAGETQVGGIMTMPERARVNGAPAHWTGYVAVNDVDASSDQLKGLGGSVHFPPTDIPGTGRFSAVSDPQGAPFTLFKPGPGSPDQPPAFAPDAPGHVGWRELHATDWEKAFAFYSGLLPWKKAQALDMGPIGTYQIVTTDGDQPAAMFTSPGASPRPFWLYYFNVGDIDAGAERVKTAGGEVLHGPHQVPGGDWALQAADPEGVKFGLLESRP